MKTAFERHDHSACADAAMARATDLAAARGLRLTPVRRRVLEIVLASLDEPRKPKPGLTRIKRNLYHRGILSRQK